MYRLQGHVIINVFYLPIYGSAVLLFDLGRFFNFLILKPGLVLWDFVMDKSGAGSGFLRELRFPLPIYIPSTSPQSSSLSPEAGTIGQEWLQCQ
jgi:hypothetical protein